MYTRRFTLGIVFLCLAVVATYFYSRSFTFPSVDAKYQPTNLTSPVAPQKMQAPNVTPRVAPRVSNVEGQDSDWNEADKKELSKWFLDNGYGPTVRKNYEAYSLETLDAMAKNGDVHAMVVLGRLALARGLNEAREIYINAAVYGSTSVFIHLGDAEEIFAFQPETDPIKRESAAVSILAWYKVASLRGDQWPELSAFDSLPRRFKFELTDDLQNRINQLAQIRYDSLQKTRYERGLGEFDNSVSPSIAKFFEQQKLGKMQK